MVVPGSTKEMAHGAWDEGLQGDIDFKVAFSKADIFHHSHKVQIINLIVNDLVKHKQVDVTDAKNISVGPEWSVLYELSEFWLVCTLRRRGSYGHCFIRILKPDLLSPVVSLSMQPANIA